MRAVSLALSSAAISAIAFIFSPSSASACESGHVLRPAGGGAWVAAAVGRSGDRLILSLTVERSGRTFPAEFSLLDGQRNQLILRDRDSGRIGRVVQARRQGDEVHLRAWSGDFQRMGEVVQHVLTAESRPETADAFAAVALDAEAMP